MNNETLEPSSNTLGSNVPTAGATTLSGEGRVPGFNVHLNNFDGPFDLLLQLISRHRMDITDVAIATVTDEFISYIKALENSENGWDLDQATEFLVVAATLLDLKAARLLPSGRSMMKKILPFLKLAICSLLACFNIAPLKRLRELSKSESLKQRRHLQEASRWTQFLRLYFLKFSLGLLRSGLPLSQIVC